MTDLYLAHHGIKGMKWGVRRYQNEDGTLTEEGKARYRTFQGDDRKFVKTMQKHTVQNYNKAVTRFNNEAIDAINDSWKNEDLYDPKKQKGVY